MLFGGALVTATFLAPEQQLSLVPVILAGTFGNLVGSWLSYWAGYVGGRPLIDRWGGYVLLRPHEIDRAEAWFADHGQAAVFFSRLLPVVRTFISLPAGVAEMPLGTFTVYTIAGCLPWTFALAGAGYAVGSQWKTVDRYFGPVSIAIGALLAYLVVPAGLRVLVSFGGDQFITALAANDSATPASWILLRRSRRKINASTTVTTG